MLETDLAWLAGLLEGEGSFRAGRTGRAVETAVQVLMTDRDVIERAARIMGGSTIGSGPLPSGKTRYWTQLSGARAAALMEQLLPYMGERRTAMIEAALVARKNGERCGSVRGI